MLDFPLASAELDLVCVLIGHIVGVTATEKGKVTLHTSGGQTFELSEDYDTVRGRIRNATGPRPF